MGVSSERENGLIKNNGRWRRKWKFRGQIPIFPFRIAHMVAMPFNSSKKTRQWTSTRCLGSRKPLLDGAVSLPNAVMPSIPACKWCLKTNILGYRVVSGCCGGTNTDYSMFPWFGDDNTLTPPLGPSSPIKRSSGLCIGSSSLLGWTSPVDTF